MIPTKVAYTIIALFAAWMGYRVYSSLNSLQTDTNAENQGVKDLTNMFAGS